MEGARRVMVMILAMILGIHGGMKVALSEVYVVVLSGDPVVHYNGSIHGFPATSAPPGKKVNASNTFVEAYVAYLVRKQDLFLERAIGKGTYKKLYSYHHLINGVAVDITLPQADLLSKQPQVLHMEKDTRFRTMTTHTPDYLGLPTTCWPKLGGVGNAGEGMVIGFVDTGVDPTHPSFKDEAQTYKAPASYTGTCEIKPSFPSESCNNKLVGARHFASAAIASGEFNDSKHFASPLDVEGHGSHTASTAAGNNGVPLIFAGFNYGYTSGMAPRAHIAVYKALYKDIGGFFADVIAAIEQAVKDGVDVISLSIGPNGDPRGTTFLQLLDVVLLSVVKAGIFVAQAAGNSGPYPSSIISYSPWILSVAASTHDRTYPNAILLGNREQFTGTGIAPGTEGEGMFVLILASDAQMRNLSRHDLNDCQDPVYFDKAMVGGKILICINSFRFSLGISTLGRMVSTAQTLQAAGVVLLMSSESEERRAIPFALDFPVITISTLKDSMAILDYYNSSSGGGGPSKASILGGQNAHYSSVPPRVTSFSARGPDINNFMDFADVLKPNIMAPGDQIWAAWTSSGDTIEGLKAQRFALISGTSMATPHVAGIAAMVKQKHPEFSPAAVASAIAATASPVDSIGKPLLAQNPAGNISQELGPATPFDFGSGAVSATGGLDPGLIFDVTYDDYIAFLCSIPGVSNSTVFQATGSNCDAFIATVKNTPVQALPSDLNLPSVTIANLNGSRIAVRRVTNVGSKAEIYRTSVVEPRDVSVSLDATWFSIEAGEAKTMALHLRATGSSTIASFGGLTLSGSEGHMVHIPISVLLKNP